jgi:hypothetical protein
MPSQFFCLLAQWPGHEIPGPGKSGRIAVYRKKKTAKTNLKNHDGNNNFMGFICNNFFTWRLDGQRILKQ